MNLAPIVLFVYNRPKHTLATLEALSINDLASESVLYIYADGPKENATVNDLKKIEETRQVIKSKTWCKEVIIFEKEKNVGLATSIVDGVTEVVNKHGEIIVLEDDIVTSKGFLKYMNDALNTYKLDNNVMHITGYMYPHPSVKLPKTFFYALPYPGGGWATWSRAWKFYNDDTQFLYNYFQENKLWDKFNSAGGNYFQSQLELNLSGKLKTWFIKWHASTLILDGLTLFPHKSLIYNIGFDNSGVHCGTTNAFDGEVAESVVVNRVEIASLKLAEKVIKNFYLQLNHPVATLSNKQKFRKNLLKMVPFKSLFKKVTRKLVLFSIPELHIFYDKKISWIDIKSIKSKSIFGSNTFFAKTYKIYDSQIGDYTYVSSNSVISKATIGKFCSIGPNFLCGWGVHPIDGISTAPMFYSTQKQNGITFSNIDKSVERKDIVIGNDVFIGANVTVLDGVIIGHGAVIGAGSVVSKNIPDYAIAVGSPIQVIKYRFEDSQIEALLKIKWWDFSEEKLHDVEKMFFDINQFIEKYKND